jgi:hypothetical protein
MKLASTNIIVVVFGVETGSGEFFYDGFVFPGQKYTFDQISCFQHQYSLRKFFGPYDLLTSFYGWVSHIGTRK